MNSYPIFKEILYSKLLAHILIFKIIRKLVKYDNLLIRSNIINKYEEQ